MKITGGTETVTIVRFSRIIRLTLYIAVSLSIFLFLQAVLYIPRIINADRTYTHTWYLESSTGNEPVIIPFMKKLEQNTTLTFYSQMGPIQNKSLCFWDLNATAVAAYFNEKPVYHIADKNSPTANIWNSFIVIRLPSSTDKVNTIKLTLTGTQVIAIGRRPFLIPTDTALHKESLYTILTDRLLIGVMGGCITMGILLILFSLHSNYNRMQGRLLGLACFLVSLYCLDFNFRSSTGPFSCYLFLKRLVIIAGSLGTYCFFSAVDHKANGRFTVSRWSWILLAAVLIFDLSAPSLGLLYSRSFYVMAATLLYFIGVIIIVVSHKKLAYEPLYIISSGLIAFCIVQSLLIMTIAPSEPAVIQFTTAITVILCCVEFLMNYQKVLIERDTFRNEYNRDSLTNAYNRRILTDIPDGIFGSAAFIDMDRFKQYNDAYGHKEGDKILRELVQTAKNDLRKDDLIIRYGGDEFIILMKEADLSIAEKIVERIRTNFKQNIHTANVDFSYGLSTIQTPGTLDISELDSAMYGMKEKKKNGMLPKSTL